MTHEVFILESSNDDHMVFRRFNTTEVMNEEEFNEYYLKNENEDNHIVILNRPYRR